MVKVRLPGCRAIEERGTYVVARGLLSAAQVRRADAYFGSAAVQRQVRGALVSDEAEETTATNSSSSHAYKRRRSRVAFLNVRGQPWLFRRLSGISKACDDAKFRVLSRRASDGVVQPRYDEMQYSEYHGSEGGHFGTWHLDAHEGGTGALLCLFVSLCVCVCVWRACARARCRPDNTALTIISQPHAINECGSWAAAPTTGSTTCVCLKVCAVLLRVWTDDEDQRELAVVLMLSDSAAYTGGRLEVKRGRGGNRPGSLYTAGLVGKVRSGVRVRTGQGVRGGSAFRLFARQACMRTAKWAGGVSLLGACVVFLCGVYMLVMWWHG
jgi:hypothetical protein